VLDKPSIARIKDLDYREISRRAVAVLNILSGVWAADGARFSALPSPRLVDNYQCASGGERTAALLVNEL